MGQGPGYRPKILALLELYRAHPAAVTTRLLECGLDWNRAGQPGHTWDLIQAVVESEPPWGPINRAVHGENWIWYLPGFDNLQTVMEGTVLALYQRAGKKATDFKRAKRPWEVKERKLKAVATPIGEFEQFFQSRFSTEETE